jgi:hypothetical protein
MTVVALMGSPLLGPAVWSSTAAALKESGWPVSVIPALAPAPRSPRQVLEHVVEHLPADRPVVVIVHSNAGLYVPALGSRRRVVGSVFVDAALPPAAGDVPMAPPQMQPVLRDMADADGLLPPWTQWWAEDELQSLFPDAATRTEVEAEQQRIPLEYFTATLQVPEGWHLRPAAYLSFSDAYDRQRDQAAAWGWPVSTLTGTHLHSLADPEGTAAAIADLLRRLGLPRPNGRASS